MTAPAATWFARAYHEIHRGRHLVLHGNIDDLVLWDDVFQPLPTALPSFLTVAGFRVVTRYDLVDGLSFADDDSRKFVQSRVDTGAAAGPPVTPPAAGQTDRARRISEAERALQARAANAAKPSVRTPADLLAATRDLLVQSERAVAVVIDQADLIFGESGANDERHQANLACLRKMITEAVPAPSGTGEPVRNIVVLVTQQAGALPNWVHRHNPHVAVIEVAPPSTAERAAFLRSAIPQFHAAEGLAPEQAAQASATLANLCDGMTIMDIRALAATSRLAAIPVTTPRRLVMRHRFGLQDDPWEQMDRSKVRRADEILARRVIGQDAAVRTVSDMLVNARIGLDFVADAEAAVTRPKGVFFFVGPTGVGKTELAKAIAELVFDDENAMRRFDMSEFSQEHASERLTGAPPGFVGHENGGLLTNWMLQRPFSVVLFDEIEKASPKIFDKFLQIIDDGRLTDGLGRTAHFSQSVVIFTSNLGASELPRLLKGYSPDLAPPYSEVREHFRSAVATYLTTDLGRPELLGRLGSGIVVFDILRREVIAKIVAKFLTQLESSAAARGYRLVFDHKAIERAATTKLAGDGSALGARQIRNPLLEEWVRQPLNKWVIENSPAPGTRIWVHRGANSPPFIVEELPGGEP